VGIMFIIGWVVTIMLPYFVWLDWNGWFRSDPLEEIVGLDTSYHGGLALLGENEVNPEYITAYKKRQEERRAIGRASPAARSLTNGTGFTDSGAEIQSDVDGIIRMKACNEAYDSDVDSEEENYEVRVGI
jgi:hypothetical protein